MDQKIQESSCAKKETVDIDILKTSKNGERKNHAIYQNNKPTFLENKDVEPVEKFRWTSTEVIPIEKT